MFYHKIAADVLDVLSSCPSRTLVPTDFLVVRDDEQQGKDRHSIFRFIRHRRPGDLTDGADMMNPVIETIMGGEEEEDLTDVNIKTSPPADGPPQFFFINPDGSAGRNITSGDFGKCDIGDHTKWNAALDDWQGDPLETIHFKAEGTHEYTALLYLPTTRTADVMDPTLRKSHVSLYVKRVFVMDDCEELLPPWLRFVRGVVDSADLPLNVSRETLQHNRQIHQIRKRLVKKLIEAMGKVLEDRRDDYVAYWRQFGMILKEGLYLDDDFRNELLKVCLWETTAGDEPCTIEEYRQRMPAKQKAMYYVTAPSRDAAASSPHLEAASSEGFEVLLMVDPIDEWVVQRVTEYQGAPMQALDRGDVQVGDDETQTEKEAREEKTEALAPLLSAAQAALDEHVQEVRLSSRLHESPAMLVTDPHALSPQMEQMLRATGQDVPLNKRILELNAEHPVVKKLEALHAGEATEGAPTFEEFVELLFGQALLAEGSTLPDPAKYARLMGRVMQ